jgi:hypothetical protein
VIDLDDRPLGRIPRFILDARIAVAARLFAVGMPWLAVRVTPDVVLFEEDA